jgi:hypothetical protein
MAFKEDVNSPLILTIGAISGLLVLVCVIGLQAWFMSEEQRELEDKYASAVNYGLKDLRTAQSAHLQGYRWLNAQKTVAAIPIDEAMKLLIENKGKLPTTQPK